VATNTTHWTFTDHLGTPIVQTSATGTVEWRAEYEPYSAVYSYRAGAAAHQLLRFPGQESDALADGREYNIYRWYRAAWGRYAQADVLGLGAEMNLFAYVADNPTGQIDPLGEAAINVTKTTERTYRRHQDLHLNDLVTQVTTYAAQLESNQYHSIEDCNKACRQTIAGFATWLNTRAADSNRRLR
jgi:RHS repeat-associated protein